MQRSPKISRMSLRSRSIVKACDYFSDKGDSFNIVLTVHHVV
jgi:hypothetical protein